MVGDRLRGRSGASVDADHHVRPCRWASCRSSASGTSWRKRSRRCWTASSSASGSIGLWSAADWKIARQVESFDASSILARIVFYVAFLFVLQLAFGIFGDNPISDLLQRDHRLPPEPVRRDLIVVITPASRRWRRRRSSSPSWAGSATRRTLAVLPWRRSGWIGIAAALNQVEIAPEIVNGLFYVMLALVVGVGIVAIGGGGIQPMRERQRALARVDEEASDEAGGSGALRGGKRRTPREGRRGPLRGPDWLHPDGVDRAVPTLRLD